MEKSVEVVGNVRIDNDITEGVTKQFPINLEYYKIHYHELQTEEKPYGIGIIKTHQDEVETIMEKSEFNHIFRQEAEAEDMIKLLMEHEVTPISLRDILEDFILV